jgi:protein involved in polysaccharide export with SLBB domain
MSDDTNYRAVTVPEDVPPAEYSYVQRRAEILQLIEEAGHPDALTQRRLADRYDVSPAQICKDFKRLRSFLADSIGQRRRTISETVYRKAIREYTDRGEYSEAIDALESWNEWLREEGVRDVQPVGAEVAVEGGGWVSMLEEATD